MYFCLPITMFIQSITEATEKRRPNQEEETQQYPRFRNLVRYPFPSIPPYQGGCSRKNFSQSLLSYDCHTESVLNHYSRDDKNEQHGISYQAFIRATQQVDNFP